MDRVKKYLMPMPRARVKPEERKSAAGRPPSIDLDAYLEMGKALIEWAKNAPVGSYFRDFILDTPYTLDQVAHAEKVSPQFAQMLDQAKFILARNWRNLGCERNSGFVRSLLPLVDQEFKKWRSEELKLTAAAASDPKTVLEEFFNKSDSPIKE